MSRFEAPPGIVTNGLVLNLDAGDPDSYTRSQPPYVEVLVVAGGGAGGGNLGGGGGAGGVIYNSAYQLTNATAVTVTVGAGGPGVTGTQAGVYGDNGSNSVFGSLTAIGGGGAGSGTTAVIGKDGGSGGGASGYAAQTIRGGYGTPGQGFDGGYGGGGSPYYGGGGGGGAGENGGTGIDGNSALAAGDGGDGLPFSILGTTYYFGGGGGGGVYYSSNAGDGGLGGGGGGGAMNGGYEGLGGGSALNDGENGTGDGTYPGFGLPGGGNAGDNTGGGGGGAQHQQHYGGNGGSGIVVVRYPGLPAATGGTITYLNGHTIHTFTSSGTFTPYLWNDLSGGGWNGSLQNGVGFNSYQKGGFFIFDASDDRVQIAPANSGPLNTVGTGDFTINFWASNNSGAAYRWILSNWSSTGTHFGMNNGGEFGGYFGDSVELDSDYIIPNDGSWHMFTATRTSGNIKLYVDTVERTVTGGAAGRTGTLSSGVTTIIGSRGNTTSQLWSGNIAGGQIYTRAFSSTEIGQNFNAQRAKFGVGWPSAAAILAAYPNASDGLYDIQPEGSTRVQQIYCDMTNGGWMLVASNDARSTLIPGGTGRNNSNYFLNRSGAIGTADPNSDYVVGDFIEDMNFTQVRIFGWGWGSTNSTYSFPSNLGTYITAEWPLTTTGNSRFTEIVARANVTFGGNSSPHQSANYYVLDAVQKDVSLNANSNQSTLGAAGVADSSGDPSIGCYLGHGSSEGSYEGWYVLNGGALDSQGYTTWVK